MVSLALVLSSRCPFDSLLPFARAESAQPRASLNVRNHLQATLKIVSGSKVAGLRAREQPAASIIMLIKVESNKLQLANSGYREKRREMGGGNGRRSFSIRVYRSDRFVEELLRPLKIKPIGGCLLVGVWTARPVAGGGRFQGNKAVPFLIKSETTRTS